MLRIALILCLLTGLAQAQWSVQTTALSSAQAAQAQVRALQALAFDAYAHTPGDGLTRVRVGCFTERDLAEAYAAAVRRRAGGDARPVRWEDGAAPRLCLGRDTGFTLPERWGVLSQDSAGVRFWLELGGVRAFAAFTESWTLAQSEAELAQLARASTLSAAQGEPLFSEDGSTVHLRWGAQRIFVTRGELLWQRGARAVVLEAGRVVAYHGEGR